MNWHQYLEELYPTFEHINHPPRLDRRTDPKRHVKTPHSDKVKTTRWLPPTKEY